MRFTRSLLTTALLLAASTLAAHADTFHYDFAANPSVAGYDITFTYDSPVLITTDTVILSSPTAPLNCLTIGVPCAKLEINPANPIRLGGAFITATDFTGSASGFGGIDLSDFTVGTHVNASGFTLIITDIPDPTSPVPEPSSIALLGTGLIGLAGIARRKFFSQS